jgi:hypothetical protein
LKAAELTSSSLFVIWGKDSPSLFKLAAGAASVAEVPLIVFAVSSITYYNNVSLKNLQGGNNSNERHFGT